MFRTFGAKVREIFVLMIQQFHRNESSWNVRSRGTNVPRERMFHGTKVLGTFAPEERKFHGSESSLHGLFAPRNESAEERKGLESFYPRMTKFIMPRPGRLLGMTGYRRVTDRRTDRQTSCHGIVRAMRTRRGVKAIKEYCKAYSKRVDR